MLDAFLKVAYEKEEKNSARQELVDAMMGLPEEDLHKIASGELKLGYMGDSSGCWLDQFQGSPLYDEALALEEQLLQVEMADVQQRSAERSARDDMWDQRDALRVKKRMLELELRKGSSPEAEEVPMEDPVEPDAEAEPKEASKKKEKGHLETIGGTAGTVGGIYGGWKAGSHVGKNVTGGPVGGLLGGLLGSSAGAHVGHHGGEALGRLGDRAIDKTKKVGQPPEKEKSASLWVADAWGRQMAKEAAVQKEALIGQALMQGARGAGNFLAQAGKGFGSALKSGNMGQVASSAKNIGGLGLRKATQWAAQNPQAAGVAGAAGLGTAGLVGAGVS